MKHAVVTGAGSGIGAATAKRLARDGFRVGLLDLDGETAAAVEREIAASGGVAYSLELDVTDADGVTSAFEHARGIQADLSVLVNSAGIVAVDRFEDFSTEVWRRTYDVNVIGTYLAMVAALPALRASEESARVINVASAAAKRPGPFTAPYNASKAAVISLSRTAAAAWAPEVLVNSVCPGLMDTPMWRDMDRRLEELRAGPGTSFADRVAELPIVRAGSAEEVAEVISSLAGPAGAYVVGEDLNVSGGLVMH
ncbi:MAG: SDR family oxidoreductase [Actinomycetota bacterium]|nr:SDR family oxidoreductase [Actinomycetota bacterium]